MKPPLQITLIKKRKRKKKLIPSTAVVPTLKTPAEEPEEETTGSEMGHEDDSVEECAIEDREDLNVDFEDPADPLQ